MADFLSLFSLRLSEPHLRARCAASRCDHPGTDLPSRPRGGVDDGLDGINSGKLTWQGDLDRVEAELGRATPGRTGSERDGAEVRYSNDFKYQRPSGGPAKRDRRRREPVRLITESTATPPCRKKYSFTGPEKSRPPE